MSPGVGFIGLQYRPGVKTVPEIPNSKLFAFSTYEAAEEYSKYSKYALTQEIWEASTSDARRYSGSLSGTASNMTLFMAEAFWTNLANNINIYTLGADAPEGTVLCPDITLIKKL